MDEDYINGILIMLTTMLGFCLPYVFNELLGVEDEECTKLAKVPVPKNKKGVTIRDVARIAECAPATVSRALNNTSYVYPDTKARIMAAVAELNYHPNIITNSIRKGKRHTIGVVVPNVRLSIFGDIAQRIDSEARNAGYSILFCHTNDDPQIEYGCLDSLRSGFVDGIIIASTGRNMSLIRDIHNQGIAVIQIIRRQDSSISSIVSDYEGGSYDAVHYLHKKGCRHIGLVNGLSVGRYALRPYKTRYEGYMNAVTELGMKPICAFTDGRINGYESGHQCIERMIDDYPELDAIMTAVDIYGMAALRITRERNIPVPGKIRIVSLTGCYVGNLLERSLTSFELPAAEIGAKAARMVIEEIESPIGSKPSIQHLMFAAALSERESS